MTYGLSVVSSQLALAERILQMTKHNAAPVSGQLTLWGTSVSRPAEPASDTATSNRHRPAKAAVVETSKQAFQKISPASFSLRARVFTHIYSCGPTGATADEIEVATGMRTQTLTARANELLQSGAIVRNGEKRKTRSGRKAFVYVALHFAKGQDLPALSVAASQTEVSQ